MSKWGIPNLRRDMLASLVPTTVFSGDPVADPEHSMFIWRTASLKKAAGMVLGFYVCDTRFECLWKQPQRYVDLFLRHGITKICEPDYSVWRDDPAVVQLYNTYKTRWLGRYWQNAGLFVIPSLNWSNEASFEFCFAGIPPRCPVAFVECRTPASCAEDRKAFLRGLHEAVHQVRPQSLVIYGGVLHEWWIRRDLPAGDTNFIFLESWTDVRRRERANRERHEREKNQLTLFPQGGTHTWAEEEVQAA